MTELKDCPSFGKVCYRQGKHRWTCKVCEQEAPKCYQRCKLYDPRNIPPRGEYVCAQCGKTHRNWLSSMHHHMRCESVLLHNLSKLVVNADGSPVAVNGSALIKKRD